jgi:Fur family ferric uptake transcriptional regulator
MGEPAKNALEVFRAFVRKKGLRNTPERETIITEIFASHEHFDVDELYLRLRIKHKKISKPSVYRLIPHLLEAGLIQESYLEDGHMHYEQIYGHKDHCHLRCVKCGKTVEFEYGGLKRLEKKLADQHGYLIRGRKVEIMGLCPDCQT